MRSTNEIIITREETIKLLTDLNTRKSQNIDGIPNLILEACRVELIDEVHGIIATLKEEQKKCQYIKEEKVRPIILPVSITNKFQNLLCEQLVKGRRGEHLEANTLNQRQFGFRQGRSCTTYVHQILSPTDKAKTGM